jgi:hypothetical protein
MFPRWFLAWLILKSWRWIRHIPPKRRLIFIGQHGVISQKIKLLEISFKSRMKSLYLRKLFLFFVKYILFVHNSSVIFSEFLSSLLFNYEDSNVSLFLKQLT